MVGIAVNTTVELLHTGLFGVVINNDGVTDGVTFIVTALLATVAVVIHAALLVSWQVTTSPFRKLAAVYVGLLVPTVVVPRFHTYTGVVPPLVGVAVNVTDVPEQIAVADAAMLTDGVIIGLTVSIAHCCWLQQVHMCLLPHNGIDTLFIAVVTATILSVGRCSTCYSTTIGQVYKTCARHPAATGK